MNPFPAILLAVAVLLAAAAPCGARGDVGAVAQDAEADTLRPRLRTLLQRAYRLPEDAELEVASVRVASRSATPNGEVSWRLAPGSVPPLAPRVAVRLEGWVHDRKESDVVVWADLHVWRSVWVVSQPVGRQAGVGSAAARERRDVCGLGGKPFDGDLSAGEWIALESLRPGAVVFAHQVSARPVVQKGVVVQGFLEQGLLSVRVQVVALDPGAPGQSIRVRNATSGKVLKAKVIDEKSVQIL